MFVTYHRYQWMSANNYYYYHYHNDNDVLGNNFNIKNDNNRQQISNQFNYHSLHNNHDTVIIVIDHLFKKIWIEIFHTYISKHVVEHCCVSFFFIISNLNQNYKDNNNNMSVLSIHYALLVYLFCSQRDPPRLPLATRSTNTTTNQSNTATINVQSCILRTVAHCVVLYCVMLSPALTTYTTLSVYNVCIIWGQFTWRNILLFGLSN